MLSLECVAVPLAWTVALTARCAGRMTAKPRSGAADDPEGPRMLGGNAAASNERILIIAADDPRLVTALQRRAAVVLQKSPPEALRCNAQGEARHWR